MRLAVFALGVIGASAVLTLQQCEQSAHEKFTLNKDRTISADGGLYVGTTGAPDWDIAAVSKALDWFWFPNGCVETYGGVPGE
jgi:hypothetical protein